MLVRALFEGCYQSPIFFATFVQTEGFQHLRCGSKTNGLALLSHSERRQVDRFSGDRGELQLLDRKIPKLGQRLARVLGRERGEVHASSAKRPRGRRTRSMRHAARSSGMAP